jgi:catechol 2,3-dioxygenase-like lactoylglutathione lyase family enzyme
VEVSIVPIKNVLASVAVQDLDTAVHWYERLLGRTPLRPMPEVAEWKFDGGGWLQVYQLSARAGLGSFTLAVDDIDGEAERLSGLDFKLGDRAANDRVKTLTLNDPDGNHIALSQTLDSQLAA